ncbi:MAG: iron-containing redox enzyme family protein [Planctomycetota bacterium]
MTPPVPAAQTLIQTNDRASVDAFLQELEQEAMRHRALNHPWIELVENAEGELLEHLCSSFAKHYQAYSAWFPRYLKTLIDRLEDPRHQELLGENLAEEKGTLHEEDREALVERGIDVASVEGVSHPALFRRYVDALGVDCSEAPAVSLRWRTRFLTFLAQAHPAAGVGAMGIGTETIVGPLYERLIKGIARLPKLSREDYVFFELHCEVDDQHQKDLLSIAADLADTPLGRSALRQGVNTALDLRVELWNHLYREAVETGLVGEGVQS